MNGQNNSKQPLLRQLPGIDVLLKAPQSTELLSQYGRTLSLEALRNVLQETRESISKGEIDHAPQLEEVVHLATHWLQNYTAPILFPVTNATGVIIHTNLGRAPLSQSALQAMHEISSGYSNLEYDIEQGLRGSRSIHSAVPLKQITGAEDALVVNNNAAAVLLMLTALCRDREVVISRGQLIEIGGGFRIPDVMAQSGARLVEVGATNRTHLYDYERAITPETAAILVAHHSNFQIVGFTSEPDLKDLAQLAHDHDLPLLYDQGSGALFDVTQFGLRHEPTITESIQAGSDLVAFSGDKLLGGPQAGIICGRSELIAALKKHPLARAVRADKSCLAALSATLSHYIRDDVLENVPVWQMIARSNNELRADAESWATQLEDAGLSVTVVGGHSTVGGGSLPGSTLPTTLVAVLVADVDDLAMRLRGASNPVIGRIGDGRLLLDPRTVLQHQAQPMLQTLIEASSNYE